MFTPGSWNRDRDRYAKDATRWRETREQHPIHHVEHLLGSCDQIYKGGLLAQTIVVSIVLLVQTATEAYRSSARATPEFPRPVKRLVAVVHHVVGIVSCRAA